MGNHKLVKVTFFDHSAHLNGFADPVRCSVVGWLISEDDVSYRIASWVHVDDAESDEITSFCVIKSVGLEVEYL